VLAIMKVLYKLWKLLSSQPVVASDHGFLFFVLRITSLPHHKWKRIKLCKSSYTNFLEDRTWYAERKWGYLERWSISDSCLDLGWNNVCSLKNKCLFVGMI
jgi:hypothetical protein